MCVIVYVYVPGTGASGVWFLFAYTAAPGFLFFLRTDMVRLVLLYYYYYSVQQFYRSSAPASLILLCSPPARKRKHRLGGITTPPRRSLHFRTRGFYLVCLPCGPTSVLCLLCVLSCTLLIILDVWYHTSVVFCWLCVPVSVSVCFFFHRAGKINIFFFFLFFFFLGPSLFHFSVQFVFFLWVVSYTHPRLGLSRDLLIYAVATGCEGLKCGPPRLG